MEMESISRAIVISILAIVATSISSFSQPYSVFTDGHELEPGKFRVYTSYENLIAGRYIEAEWLKSNGNFVIGKNTIVVHADSVWGFKVVENSAPGFTKCNLYRRIRLYKTGPPSDVSLLIAGDLCLFYNGAPFYSHVKDDKLCLEGESGAPLFVSKGLHEKMYPFYNLDDSLQTDQQLIQEFRSNNKLQTVGIAMNERIKMIESYNKRHPTEFNYHFAKEDWPW